jgi:hypothetical protein
MARELIVVLSQAAGSPIIRSILEGSDMAASATHPAFADLADNAISRDSLQTSL